MSKSISPGFNRRLFIQSALAAAVFPTAWAYGSPCRGPQPNPPGDLPRGPFGIESTAEQVTAGLDLNGINVVITGCNSGLGYETMRVLASRGAPCDRYRSDCGKSRKSLRQYCRKNDACCAGTGKLRVYSCLYGLY